MSDKNEFGAPPRLAWIAVDVLVSDPTYQRSIDSRRSKTNINRIAANFSWALFGAATVTETGDTFAIIDGQHRVEAARRLGVPDVPCLIVEAVDVAAQARLFVDANRFRVALTPLATHASLVAAGDPEAVAIKAACDEAGVELLRSPVPKEHIKAGQSLAVGAVRQVYRRQGHATLAWALRLVAKHWPQPGEIRAERIKGLALAIEKHGTKEVAGALDVVSISDLEDRMDAIRYQRECHQAKALCSAVSELLAKQETPVRSPGADDLPEDTAVLSTAVMRRCSRCNGIFKTRLVAQIECDSCKKQVAA